MYILGWDDVAKQTLRVELERLQREQQGRTQTAPQEQIPATRSVEERQRGYIDLLAKRIEYNLAILTERAFASGYGTNAFFQDRNTQTLNALTGKYLGKLVQTNNEYAYIAAEHYGAAYGTINTIFSTGLLHETFELLRTKTTQQTIQ